MYDVRIPLLGKYIVLYIRTQQWFEVRTHDLSGRPIAAYHNLTFPLSWVQKVSYRSKRQSGRAVYRHLSLLCLLYCIPDAALFLFSPSFVRLRCRSLCSCSACMLKKKTPPKPYVLPPLRSSRGSRGHLFHESEPGLFLVWSPIQNPFAVLIGGVSSTLLSTFLFLLVYSGCGVSGSSCMRLQSVVTQICFIAMRVTNFASEVW
jgi:hypothetical protein